MTPERWQRVERLYHAALEREAGGRPAFLDEACGGDLELRQEVESLLAVHDSRDAFLEIPAVAVAAEALAEPSGPLPPGGAIDYNGPRAMSASPSKIGRYAVRRRLGGGGMGIVYLAHDPVIDRLVAVKVLRTALDDGDMRERFAREARSTGSLFHRNIVTVFDAGEHEGQPFIAMEFVDGRSVDELVRTRELLTLERRLRMIEDLCSGLSYAHRRGIVHRDIKPANLMLASDGVLKVLDFGIARLVDAGVSRVTAVGTPSYMSPEQVWGARVDHRADIFAVGLVLYEVLAYARAFPGDALPRICHAIVSEEPKPLIEFVPDLDPDVIRIVALALKKNPAERYQDVAVLSGELEAARSRLAGRALQSMPSVAARPGGESAPRSPKRRTDPAELAERRARRVDEACATAEAKLAAGEYEAAIAAAEEALVVDPTELRAIRLVEGARAQLDDHRARMCLSEAAALVEAGALTKAETLLREAATLAPGAPELRVLQERIAGERRERAEAEQRRQQVESAIERARAALSRDEPDVAIEAANAALAVDATSATALQVRQEATARLEARRIQRERDAQTLIARARGLVGAGLDVAALRLLTSSSPPRHPLVDREIAATQARVDEAQRKARAQAATPHPSEAPVRDRSEDPPTAVTAVKGATRAGAQPEHSLPPTAIESVPAPSRAGNETAHPAAEPEIVISNGSTVTPRRRAANRRLLFAAAVVGALALTVLLVSRSFQTPSAGERSPVVAAVDRIAEPLQRARRALADGRIAVARAAFDEVLAVVPDHREAIDGKARTSRMLDVASLLGAARELAAQGRRDDAIRQYEEVLALSPQEPGIAAELAKLKQPPPTTPAADGATRTAADGMNDLLRSAEQAMRNRDYDVAIQRFATARRIDPSDRRAIDGFRRATDAKARADEALAKLEGRVPPPVSTNPAPDVTRIERLMKDGLKAMEAGDYPAAQKAVEEVLRLDPKHARARALLNLLTGQGA